MPSWFHASAPAAGDLAPFNPPLGVYPDMARPTPTILQIKEGIMSMSGDDFSVKDQDGRTVVKCKGKAMSMRERKSAYRPIRPVLVVSEVEEEQGRSLGMQIRARLSGRPLALEMSSLWPAAEPPH